MKRLPSILAAIALTLLMVPCVHAEEHHHSDETAALSAPACKHCHSCVQEACSKPRQLTQISPTTSADLPVRSAPLVAVFDVSVPVSVPAPRPPAGVLLLQTVQLLI